MARDEMATCSHCGGEMKRNAKACPHCGSDDETGWSPDTYLDGIDLPGDDSYEEMKQNEFGETQTGPSGRRWMYIAGAVILVVFLLGIVSSFFGEG